MSHITAVEALYKAPLKAAHERLQLAASLHTAAVMKLYGLAIPFYTNDERRAFIQEKARAAAMQAATQKAYNELAGRYYQAIQLAALQDAIDGIRNKAVAAAEPLSIDAIAIDIPIIHASGERQTTRLHISPTLTPATSPPISPPTSPIYSDFV